MATATPSSYSITVRLHTTPDHALVGRVATAVAEQGGIVTAIDVADSRHDRLVVDRGERLEAARAGYLATATDIATRLLRFGPDVKLGVFISVIGAPFFLWLVLHLRKTSP